MMKQIRFEVIGKVQGVYFRKYTKLTADKYSINGWCQNTPEGTVIGEASGNVSNIDAFLKWLREEGSPSSKIDDLKFILIDEPFDVEYTGFVIDRSKNGRNFPSLL